MNPHDDELLEQTQEEEDRENRELFDREEARGINDGLPYNSLSDL